MIAFNGEDNVLSNFFPCEINLYGVCHKSAEHAFQYAKAMQCGDLDAAKTILTAEDALSANNSVTRSGSTISGPLPVKPS